MDLLYDTAFAQLLSDARPTRPPGITPNLPARLSYGVVAAARQGSDRAGNLQPARFPSGLRRRHRCGAATERRASVRIDRHAHPTASSVGWLSGRTPQPTGLAVLRSGLASRVSPGLCRR